MRSAAEHNLARLQFVLVYSPNLEDLTTLLLICFYCILCILACISSVLYVFVSHHGRLMKSRGKISGMGSRVIATRVTKMLGLCNPLTQVTDITDSELTQASGPVTLKNHDLNLT